MLFNSRACAPCAAQAGPAFAEEAAEAAGAVDPPPDIVTSIFFTLAIALLVVLTGGIAYLGIMDALDKKTEREEREKFDRESRGAPTPLQASARREARARSQQLRELPLC